MDEWFIVRGPNWRINIKVSKLVGEEEYRYIEAATRAIESIYNGDEELVIYQDHSPKFSGITEVAVSGFDIDLYVTEDPELDEMIRSNDDYFSEQSIKHRDVFKSIYS